MYELTAAMVQRTFATIRLGPSQYVNRFMIDFLFVLSKIITSKEKACQLQAAMRSPAATRSAGTPVYCKRSLRKMVKKHY